MVKFPKITHCHGNFTKNILFSWETFTYGNISVALVIKYPCIYETSFSMLWTQLHSRFLVNFPLRSKFPWPFLTVRLLPWLWHIGQRPLAYRAVMAAICQWLYNRCANCQDSPFCFFAPARSLWSIFLSGSSRNGCAADGLTRPSQRDMPMD
jgi:hypothetical protein